MKRLDSFKCNVCFGEFEIYHDTNNVIPEKMVCDKCGSSDITQKLSAPRTVGTTGGLNSRTPEGFKDLLKASLKNVPSSYAGKEPTCL